MEGEVAVFTDEYPMARGQFDWIADMIRIPAAMLHLFPATSLLWHGVKLLVLGSVIETGRRILKWIVDRFRIRWSISAVFSAGDITHEWLVHYLIQENVWRTPRNILIRSKNSRRKTRLNSSPKNKEVDYVPDFGPVQFFRWRGYWFEVSSSQRDVEYRPYGGRNESAPYGHQTRAKSVYLSIYTLDVSILAAFVEECRLKYAEHTKSKVVVYTTDSGSGRFPGGVSKWTTVKVKHRRPLDSLLLDDNTVDSLLADAREFMEIGNWYIDIGIPHRRGYLLHGPPGSGKTSTVYALAGELGLEIYALSLSARWYIEEMNDYFLSRLVSTLPSRGILLIEDIDCAFPSRDEINEAEYDVFGNRTKSQITMSGLLNILDGIGSGERTIRATDAELGLKRAKIRIEEGKIFFATTNYIDRLDPALIRPGRIDRVIEYKLASGKQAHALFMRFFSRPQPDPAFPFEHFRIDGAQPAAKAADARDNASATHHIRALADEFADAVPENAFNMAELQGYLLDWKRDPVGAVHGVAAWVACEQDAKREKEAARRDSELRREAARTEEQRRFVYGPVKAGVQMAMAAGGRPRRGRRGHVHVHGRRPPSAPSQCPRSEPMVSDSEKESTADQVSQKSTVPVASELPITGGTPDAA